MSKLIGLLRGKLRRRLMHGRTRFARTAARAGVSEALLRDTYKKHYSPGLVPSEFCRYIIEGEITPDGKEFA